MKYLKYTLWVLLVIVPCITTVLIYNDKIEKDSPIYYKQGINFYNEGDYSDAFYNFSKIKKISPLYPMSILKQAKSAQKIGDYKTAAIKYDIFLKKMPESVFTANARLNLAKSYYYLKRYDEAKREFELLSNNLKNDGTEEIFFLGLTEKKLNKERAAKYFKRYLKAVFDNNALNLYYVLSSAQELYNLGVPLSNEDLKLVGMAFFKEHQYKEALECFNKLPVEQCWDFLVLTNHYLGNKISANKLIESGLVNYGAFSDENNLKDIYNIYSSYLLGNRFKNWSQLEKFVNENKLKSHDYILYKIANLLTREKAIKYYKEIYNRYPFSSYAPEALWQIIWEAYKKNDFILAEKLCLEHLNNYKKVISTPKVMFWLAKIYEKQNKISETNTALNRLSIKYPDNYYGLRAKFILEKNNNFWRTSNFNRLAQKNSEIDFPLSLSEMDLKDLKLINTLFNLGDYEIWIDSDYATGAVESWFEYKKGKKSRSIVLARDEIAKMEPKAPTISSIYKLAYPLYYAQEINISSEKLELDPYLILSIIREESYFNEYARSSTGAMGLMQLMPQTANYMFAKLNLPNDANIDDARINLYLGSNYLKYLKDKFNNDLFVTAAYNGGEGSVQKWIKNFYNGDNDEFIEDIPFDETRNYVKKVFRTYNMYKKIYM